VIAEGWIEVEPSVAHIPVISPDGPEPPAPRILCKRQESLRCHGCGETIGVTSVSIEVGEEIRLGWSRLATARVKKVVAGAHFLVYVMEGSAGPLRIGCIRKKPFEHLNHVAHVLFHGDEHQLAEDERVVRIPHLDDLAWHEDSRAWVWSDHNV
jgi:hypothetical protein